ncbi:hypothetical protein NW765_008464 [Fusarium oxysporum]|nr:hypothetical protein NW765_008464 [Fusarium oxysporum]
MDMDEGVIQQQQAIEADDFLGGRTVHSAPITSEYAGHVDIPPGHHPHSHPGNQSIPGRSDGSTWRWRRRSSQRPVTATDLVAPDHDPAGSPVIIPFTHAQFASPLAVRAHNHPHIHPQSHPNSPYTHPHVLHHQILPTHQSLSHSHLSDDSATVGGHFGTMEQIETQASDLRFLAQVPVLNPTSSPLSAPAPAPDEVGLQPVPPGAPWEPLRVLLLLTRIMPVQVPPLSATIPLTVRARLMPIRGSRQMMAKATERSKQEVKETDTYR